MIVHRQYHDGIAYDKREPFLFRFLQTDIHGLVLYTDRDPRNQPPLWDRLEHYRIGVVFGRQKRYTFKLWTQRDGLEVMFNNNAEEFMYGSVGTHVQIQSMCGPQDKAFDHVIRGLLDHYHGWVVK